MDEIKYPKRESEAEIQAALWSELKKEGIDARLQVLGTIGSKRAKFDLVVFKNQAPQLIIECKSWSKRYSKERLYQLTKNTKQIRKYESFGLPVFVCGRPEAIPKVIELVKESYHAHHYEHI